VTHDIGLLQEKEKKKFYYAKQIRITDTIIASKQGRLPEKDKAV